MDLIEDEEIYKIKYGVLPAIQYTFAVNSEQITSNIKFHVILRIRQYPFANRSTR